MRGHTLLDCPGERRIGKQRRILRQVLTESILLSGLGGAAGLALGYVGRSAIPRLLEDPWRPGTTQLDFDWRVLAFTVAVSLATGLLFGIVPAWQAARPDANSGSKDGTHATQRPRTMWLGKSLVVLQVALSTILLIGAGLFVRTLVNLSKAPVGFHTDHLLLFELNLPTTRYNNAQAVELFRRLEERLASIPGVKSETLSGDALIANDMSTSGFHVSGKPTRKEDQAGRNVIGADFFETMGIAMQQGRAFDRYDTLTAPTVALVNRALERKYFGHESAMGKTFRFANHEVAIVGVVSDTKYADLRTDPLPTFYLDYVQWPQFTEEMTIEIRTYAEPGSVLSGARAAVESLDRDLPLINVRTQEQQIKATMAGERIFAQLTGGFGVLALVLASIGIYGIMAYTVARRTSEIGIRMALGAPAEKVLWMVLREASWMALAGVALGTLAAVLCFRLVSTMLYGLEPSDPAVLAGASLLLICIALLAGFGPARRASRVDPMHALRHE
jgi:predicted permease